MNQIVCMQMTTLKINYIPFFATADPNSRKALLKSKEANITCLYCHEF